MDMNWNIADTDVKPPETILGFNITKHHNLTPTPPYSYTNTFGSDTVACDHLDLRVQ